MAEQKSFRQLESELNTILEKVEHASYDELDELLQDYKSGKELIKELESRLTKAKNSIVKAKKV